MWTRLTNTEPGHFKFWSVEWVKRGGKKHLTGKVQFGRIGGAANEYHYCNTENVRQKFRSKLKNGYTKLNESTNGAVFTEEVRVMEWC
jgi:hypothetical protein